MAFDATARHSAATTVPGKGDAGTDKVRVYTYELASSTVGTTIDWCNIPSNARILGTSRVYIDDCATTGAPILTTGLGAVNSNLVNSDDPDGIGGGVTLATAGTYDLVNDPANIGLHAWDLVASETTDPGGFLKVYSSVTAADTTTTGTVTLELRYSLD